MGDRGYLVDTSVLGRAHQEPVGERIEALAQAGQMWTCGLVDLEVVYGARARDVGAIIEERNALPRAPITPSVMARSIRLAEMLAEAGHHRGAKPVDLVIAATAESARLTVLHYDAGYERIAAVSNQRTEWIAPPGSLD